MALPRFCWNTIVTRRLYLRWSYHHGTYNIRSRKIGKYRPGGDRDHPYQHNIIINTMNAHNHHNDNDNNDNDDDKWISGHDKTSKLSIQTELNPKFFRSRPLASRGSLSTHLGCFTEVKALNKQRNRVHRFPLNNSPLKSPGNVEIDQWPWFSQADLPSRCISHICGLDLSLKDIKTWPTHFLAKPISLEHFNSKIQLEWYLPVKQTVAMEKMHLFFK